MSSIKFRTLGLPADVKWFGEFTIFVLLWSGQSETVVGTAGEVSCSSEMPIPTLTLRLSVT